MSNRSQLEELRQLLVAAPREALADAIIEYATSDDNFRHHFMAIGRMLNSKSADKTLEEVSASIEQVFGDDDIPGSLDWEERTKFMHVAELIEAMLKLGLNDAVIQASERCFELVENLAGVHSPDDFLDCYEPIIRSWILALHRSGIPSATIAQQVNYLETSDQYGAFYDLADRFPDELGQGVLRELKSMKVKN